jgi:predicted site-specific integrase-resolvase
MNGTHEGRCPLCGEPRPLLSIKAAAALAGVSRKTIYRWIKARLLLHCTLPSGMIRVYPDSLIRRAPETYPRARVLD